MKKFGITHTGTREYGRSTPVDFVCHPTGHTYGSSASRFGAQEVHEGALTLMLDNPHSASLIQIDSQHGESKIQPPLIQRPGLQGMVLIIFSTQTLELNKKTPRHSQTMRESQSRVWKSTRHSPLSSQRKEATDGADALL